MSAKKTLDAMAHDLYKAIVDVRVLEPETSRGRIYDNGDGLYTIHNLETGEVTLVVAPSIREARDMVLGGPC